MLVFAGFEITLPSGCTLTRWILFICSFWAHVRVAACRAVYWPALVPVLVNCCVGRYSLALNKAASREGSWVKGEKERERERERERGREKNGREEMIETSQVFLSFPVGQK